jgi:hypothetical protein
MRANDFAAIALSTAILVIGSASSCSALAQNLYKHVDANGKVTYTDVPLSPEEKQLAISNTARNGDGDGARAKKAGRKQAQGEGNSQAKGKGGKGGKGGNGENQGRQKKPAASPDTDSQK